MDAREAYNVWADQYDTTQNKTRDLEGIALIKTLANFKFKNCLEIGCGTGKNTPLLLSVAEHVTAVDISEAMLEKAKEKIKASNLIFHTADITKDWDFTNKIFELITFSLVLEHIEQLDNIFRKAAAALASSGSVYIGELHPFKQYMGTKARFETENGQQIVNCYNHNLSDFTQAAQNNGFEIIDINEFFDDNDKKSIPRILTLLLRKK